MNIVKLLKNERQTLAVLGMTPKEFELLLVTFSNIYKLEKKSKERKRKLGGGRKGFIKDIKNKLFVTLFYLKVYPTYDLAGFIFGVDGSRVCEWIAEYLPILEKALGREAVLPVRKINSAEEFSKLFPWVKDAYIDGTERPIQRPKKGKNKKKTYSGKKKVNTRKNILVSDDKKKILYVSPTKGGRIHDINQIKKTNDAPNIPSYVSSWLDKGFVGLEGLIGGMPFIPKKKPPKKNLSDADKESNKIISSIRITIENAICGVKRFGAATATLRNKIGIDDAFVCVCAGLWNFHLQYS